MDIKQKHLTHPPSKLGIFSWCLYSFAATSFSSIIIIFVFGPYFTRHIAQNSVQGGSYWGWTIGVAGIFVAICSPFLGSISDFTGWRKLWLAFFTLVCVIASALLWFSQPSRAWMWYTMIVVAIATIGFEFIQVFYNSMLSNIAPKKYLGRISGWSFALHFVGGVVCLALALYAFIYASWVPKAHDANIRATTLLAAIWFLVFSIPLFLFTADKKQKPISLAQACRKGVRELWQTLCKARQYKGIFLYLIAHLLFMDSVVTLSVLGGVFAVDTFHMDYSQVLIFAVITNVLSAIGAFLLAFLDDWMSAKFTLCLSLIVIVIINAFMWFLPSLIWFWVCAAAVGFFLGPVFASGRSYMVRISPPHLQSQMFGLYQISGRVTSFIGPIMVATVTSFSGNQQLGMSLISVTLLIGLILLLFCPKH